MMWYYYFSEKLSVKMAHETFFCRMMLKTKVKTPTRVVNNSWSLGEKTAPDVPRRTITTPGKTFQCLTAPSNAETEDTWLTLRGAAMIEAV